VQLVSFFIFFYSAQGIYRLSECSFTQLTIDFQVLIGNLTTYL